VTIAGIQMQNPVTVASGTFGYGKEYAHLVDLRQLGARGGKVGEPKGDKALAAKLTAEQRRESARRAARARWAKPRKRKAK
jgi:hypothetical protein